VVGSRRPPAAEDPRADRSILPLILSSLAACNGKDTDTSETAPPVDTDNHQDNTYCIEVTDPDAPCPPSAEVSDPILGNHCEIVVVAITGEGTRRCLGRRRPR
jgi:hypothetical protein